MIEGDLNTIIRIKNDPPLPIVRLFYPNNNLQFMGVNGHELVFKPITTGTFDVLFYHPATQPGRTKIPIHHQINIR